MFFRHARAMAQLDSCQGDSIEANTFQRKRLPRSTEEGGSQRRQAASGIAAGSCQKCRGEWGFSEDFMAIWPACSAKSSQAKDLGQPAAP